MSYKDRNKQLSYQAAHYQSNKSIYRDRLRQRRQDNQDFVDDLKLYGRCSCGESDVCCLEYHHRDSNQKDFSVSHGVKQGYSREKIINEITKCDLLCSNCHSILHTLDLEEYKIPRVGRNARWLREYKLDKVCCRCGFGDSRCLCFHHIGDKKMSIATMAIKGYAVSSIAREIEQCLVLCLNCHRKEHNGNRWDVDSMVRR